MNLARAIAVDIAKALAVLALVFLSFAHQPVELSQPSFEYRSVTGLTFCGTPPGGGDHGPGPCHACRAGVADLPAPPCAPQPAGFALATAQVYTGDDAVLPLTSRSPANPRAPPALA